MCSIIDFTEKESLYVHLIEFHHSEKNNTPHYCLICNKGYCSFKVYQDHLIAEQDIHGSNQSPVLTLNCNIILCTNTEIHLK